MKASGKRGNDVAPLEYAMRHLNPVNLSPLKRRMRKQLQELREIRGQAPGLVGPYGHRLGSRYLHTLLNRGS